MKKALLTALLSIAFTAYAQNDTSQYTISRIEFDKLKTDISALRLEIQAIKNEGVGLSSKLENFESRINNAENSITDNQSSIDRVVSELGNRIDTVGSDANTRIVAVGHLLSSATSYAIIGGVILLLIIITIYFILRHKQKAERTDFLKRLDKIKSSLEEGLVKEFSRHAELMSAQLESRAVATIPNAGGEPDHSLALKLANEINLIERNISFMDPGTKGLKQLQRSVSKLKDNLSANGYEIPILLGRKYDSGMKVIVTGSISDENLTNGEKIISRIIIPQVNYNEIMIQPAQIEVAVGT